MKIKKKNIYIIIICVLFIILTFITFKIINKKKNEKNFENSVLSFSAKNEKTIFSINKILFFSSSDSKNKTSTGSNFTIENLYTYTDIAIFINTNSEEQTLENTLKSLRITNIKYKETPTIGEPNLYYKSVQNFAKSEIEEENKIENELNFEITSEEKTNFDKPILYNNCANPITLSYINQNIKTDYTIIDITNPITYDGTLLKKCAVPLSSLKTQIYLEIEIENNKTQKFRTNINIDIPYQDDEKSIYDGNLIVKREVNNNFYRYE